MTFEQLNLNPRIFKAIELCGYKEPTSIQSRTIPEILTGRDLVASAQTGTGKTAAFVLPALDRVSAEKSNGKPRVLILTPTRELASQICDAVNRYGKFLQVNIVSLLGGMPYHKQLKALSRAVDIIIATPGRLMDHMERGRVDLSQIEMLILDEADRMLDMGFIDDVKLIASKTPKDRQTLLFSATVDNRISQVIRTLLNNPVRVESSNEKITPAQIKQELYYADSPQHKMRLLQHLLQNENIYKAIIFSATKINADRLAKELSDLDYPAAPLHGDLKQNQRNKTVEQLRRGKIQFLVATDVAARGIDISDVTHVINYDLPKFSEDYVHRIGRTGRAGKSGIAISFALPNDTRHLQKIERYIGQKFIATTIPGLEPTKRQKSSSSDQGRPGKGKKKFGGSDKSSEYGRKKRFDDDRPFRKEGRKFSDGDRSFRKDDRKSASGDRPFRSEGRKFSDNDKPFRKDDRKFASGDRPFRSEGRKFSDGDKPFRKDDRKSAGGDKPFRSEGRKSAGGDRPFRSEVRKSAGGDRPFRSEGRKSAGGDRPFRSEGRKSADSDRPFRSEGRKSADSDRPFRSEGRKSAGGDRPFRSEGRKSTGGDKPFRSEGRKFSDNDKPFRKDDRKSAGGDRPFRKEGRKFSDSSNKLGDRKKPAKFVDRGSSDKPRQDDLKPKKKLSLKDKK